MKVAQKEQPLETVAAHTGHMQRQKLEKNNYLLFPVVKIPTWHCICPLLSSTLSLVKVYMPDSARVSRSQPESAGVGWSAGVSRSQPVSPSQPESAGVSRSQPESAGQPESADVSRSAEISRSQPVSRSQPEPAGQPESAGVSRSQPESAGLSRTQPESAGVSRSAVVSRSQPLRFSTLPPGTLHFLTF